MKPRSLSASALQVAEMCLARYHAENILRTERPANSAATLGTTVHSALEIYVTKVYIEKTREPDLEFLLDLFSMFFARNFGTFDQDSDDYRDGIDMLKRWFGRTDLSDRTVISVEKKTSFDVKTTIGPIPFNYIWDRFDQLGEKEFEVVDYKTIRLPVSPEDLKKKIQARCYGLAAQIQRPDAERIWVRFDLLRHESVATVFTRQDNIATWNYLKRSAERIIEASDKDLLETLNAECCWCVRKTSCKALQSNLTGGGVLRFGSALEVVDLRAKLEYQRKAVEYAIKEIDEVVLKEAAETDTLEFESETSKLEIGWSTRRQVDPERVLPICGRDLFHKYGGDLMTYTQFNKLLKDSAVGPEMKRKLQSLVYSKSGTPVVKVVPKNVIDD